MSSAKKETTASRYKGYAQTPQGGSAGRHQPNYIVERASPAMLCLTRRAQARPYAPLSTEAIAQAAQPLDYSLRQPPHVSHQAVMELYRCCHGHYNIVCDQPGNMELVTLGSHAHGGKGLPYRQQQQQQQQQQPSAATSAAASNTVGGSTGTNTCVSSSAEPDFTQAVEDYRLSQLRKNVKHVDTSSAGRICNYYNTREGCRRGVYCEYAHIGKDGEVVHSPQIAVDTPRSTI